MAAPLEMMTPEFRDLTVKDQELFEANERGLWQMARLECEAVWAENTSDWDTGHQGRQFGPVVNPFDPAVRARHRRVAARHRRVAFRKKMAEMGSGPTIILPMT